MQEWKTLAASERHETAEFEQRCEQERAVEREQVELEKDRRRCLMNEWRSVADSPRYEVDPAERRQREREQTERETERVYEWLERRNYEDARSEPIAAADTNDGGWNAWFDRRFMELMRPVLEATGQHVAGLLDEERKQSREELALEVQRLNSEATRLFAIIAELQQTIAAFNRVEAAQKRDAELALPRRGVH
jgi:hypothetical protein